MDGPDMALRLPDRWLWDFWLARDGSDYHLFFLQAPRSLGDPELRHWNASIGHAVSSDLERWEVLPDVLGPGREGSWDDYTTWTGSVVEHAGRWCLLYTGTSRAEDGLIQRIGLATSEDLVAWERHRDNPVLEADPAWYELLDVEVWHDQAWRDPWVFRHPEGGRFHALITARVRGGAGPTRGVIGLAASADLERWEVLPPLTEPGHFGHMEVPQLFEVGGRWYLLFSAPGSSRPSTVLGDTVALTGTHYLVADDPLGPFEWRRHGVLLGDGLGTWYGGKLVRDAGGRLVCLAWRSLGSNGRFAGELSDPMPVEEHGGGLEVGPES